jgi:lysophospholipase L1-like esterase
LAISLISIGLNYYLFSRGKRYYLQLGEIRLDPLGLSAYPTGPGQQDLTGPDRPIVVFFGDSRAETWLPPPNLPQFTFVNRGITAQTSMQVARRFDYHVRPLQPQIVVVQLGINDLNIIPVFPEQKERIISDCKENIQQIAAWSVDLGAVVILTTVFPFSRIPFPRRLAWSREVALAIEEVNAYIRSLAGESIIVFDTHSILADDAGITWPQYREDPFHINTTGYEALNDEFAHILTALEPRLV